MFANARRAALMRVRMAAWLVGAMLLAGNAPARAHDDDMPGMPGMSMHQHTGPASLAERLLHRSGSGTSWQPQAEPMFGTMTTRGSVTTMTHAALFVRDVSVPGKRGGTGIDTPGWIMSSSSTIVGTASVLRVRGMVHVDGLTVHGAGYPERFQNGEDFGGNHIGDHQHPHKAIGELSLDLTRIGRRGGVLEIYAGDPAEPALGPPAFVHRRIGYDLPDAPLGHHWFDSTHISNGVVTAAVGGSRVKFEDSIFTGREPSIVPTQLGRARFDSSAQRLSWAPTAWASGEISVGRLRSPEALEPGSAQHRLIASLALADGGGDRDRSLALMWARRWMENHPTTAAFLVEGTARRGATTFVARFEHLAKDDDELGLPATYFKTFAPLSGPAPLHNTGTFGSRRAPLISGRIAAVTIGGVRDLHDSPIGIGVEATITAHSAVWNNRYGTPYRPGSPLALGVYARYRPHVHRHEL